MSKPQVSSIDKALGKCLKKHRLRAHISQTALGKHLGVTFQQVQKFENGRNRLSAGQLFRAVDLLKIPPADLAELDAPRKQPTPGRKAVGEFSKSTEGKMLLLNFLAIEDKDLREHVLNLLRMMHLRRL